MYKQWLSAKKAKSFALVSFLIGLGIISITDSWWPSIMIVIGCSLAIRQVLLRKYYDAFISILIFFGVYFTQQYETSPKVLLPVVFFTSALFLLIREYTDSKLLPEDQKEEDLNHEIEETEKKKK